MEKSVIKLGDRDEVLKHLEEELRNEYIEKIRERAKALIKEIKMTKILLEKKQKQLDDMLSGTHQYTEEEILFD